MAKQKEKEEVIIDVEGGYDKAERFFEDNQKYILGFVAAIIIIIGGYVGWKKFIIAPKEAEAATDMFHAEQYFQQDSFKLALDGKGENVPGFLYIIENYGMTDAANLSYYYAGISYLHLGEYQNAIDHLAKFSSGDEVLSVIAEGATGDAYMELGEVDNAISHYLAAAGKNDNKFTSPIYLMKAAQATEGKGDFDKAVKLYERLEKEFPTSAEGKSAEKYKARAQASLQ